LKNRAKFGQPKGYFIYDGDCSFCMRSTKLIAGTTPNFNVVASINCIELLAKHNIEKRLTEEVAIWISSSGEVKLGAFAIAAALKKGNFFRGILGVIIDTFPINYLAKAVYRQIAKRRKFFRWGESSCAVKPSSTAKHIKMKSRIEFTARIFLTWQFLLPSLLFLWRLVPGEGILLYGWGWQMFS
jgi:predicted DCC family thiol-disulfide oxidoreductase YuxK